MFRHNRGDYEQGLKAYLNARKWAKGDLDYSDCGMAASNPYRDGAEKSPEPLKKAIEISQETRYCARSDPNSHSMAKTGKFLKLPKIPVA